MKKLLSLLLAIILSLSLLASCANKHVSSTDTNGETEVKNLFSTFVSRKAQITP